MEKKGSQLRLQNVCRGATGYRRVGKLTPVKRASLTNTSFTEKHLFSDNLFLGHMRNMLFYLVIQKGALSRRTELLAEGHVWFSVFVGLTICGVGSVRIRNAAGERTGSHLGGL